MDKETDRQTVSQWTKRQTDRLCHCVSHTNFGKIELGIWTQNLQKIFPWMVVINEEDFLFCKYKNDFQQCELPLYLVLIKVDNLKYSHLRINGIQFTILTICCVLIDANCVPPGHMAILHIMFYIFMNWYLEINLKNSHEGILHFLSAKCGYNYFVELGGSDWTPR